MNGKKWKRMFNSFKVWKRAQQASQNVGLEFRRILNGLPMDTTVIITHSLGASVVTSALFNVDKFGKGAVRDRIMAVALDTIQYRTPASIYRVGMLAPAIPGINTFDEFGHRTPVSPYDSSRYYFVIGFNRYDQTLRKYIGLEKKFGATTLGCRWDELEAVKKMLNSSSTTIIDHAEFSRLPDGQKQKSHAFVNYIRNDPAMRDFLRKLF